MLSNAMITNRSEGAETAYRYAYDEKLSVNPKRSELNGTQDSSFRAHRSEIKNEVAKTKKTVAVRNNTSFTTR